MSIVILIQTFLYKGQQALSFLHLEIESPAATMKFTAAALLAALTVTCYAQRVKIGSPANGTSVSPGSNLVVQVDRPVSIYTPGWITTLTLIL